jgi:hypothetical protein
MNIIFKAKLIAKLRPRRQKDDGVDLARVEVKEQW